MAVRLPSRNGRIHVEWRFTMNERQWELYRLSVVETWSESPYKRAVSTAIDSARRQWDFQFIVKLAARTRLRSRGQHRQESPRGRSPTRDVTVPSRLKLEVPRGSPGVPKRESQPSGHCKRGRPRRRARQTEGEFQIVTKHRRRTLARPCVSCEYLSHLAHLEPRASSGAGAFLFLPGG